MSILARQHAGFAKELDALGATLREGGPFVVTGGGTSRIGLAEGTALHAPKGVWDYDPSALTLTAAAGTDLAEIEALLASENQRLAFEPPRLGALLGREGTPTLGGVVAGNLSGPRRVGVGACRDFCLGVAFLDGQGTWVKNGGRVMKNVTGLDLVKLMAGSHGTLGLICEVSLKVQPIPEVTLTLTLDGLSDAQAVAAMSAALGTPFDVTGAVYLSGQTHLRLEGIASSARYRMAELQKVLAPFGTGVVSEDVALWDGVRDLTPFADRAGDVWRVAVKPSDAPAVVAASGADAAIYDWAGARVWLLMPVGADLRARMSTGHATLVRAAEADKTRLGVFPPLSPIEARLSAGLRAKFDPDMKFNRGMMG